METSPENAPVKAEIEGSYGNKTIRLEFLPVPGNKKVLINVHGTYGTMHGGGNKYLDFAERLKKSKSCNAVLYESSRKDDVSAEGKKKDYSGRKNDFEGKTFDDEIEDLRRVIRHCVTNSKKLFGVESPDLEISLNGNSLGGILSLVIAGEFPQIKNISTVGTGLRLEPKDTPILSTIPGPLALLSKIRKFNGNLLVQYGTADDIFTKESCESLLQGAKNAKKSIFVFDGVDHTFKKLDGKSSAQPYQQVFRNVRVLVDEGELVGGGTHLTHEDKLRADDDAYEAVSAEISRKIAKLGLSDKFADDTPYDDSAPDNH